MEYANMPLDIDKVIQDSTPLSSSAPKGSTNVRVSMFRKMKDDLSTMAGEADVTSQHLIRKFIGRALYGDGFTDEFAPALTVVKQTSKVRMRVNNDMLNKLRRMAGRYGVASSSLARGIISNVVGECDQSIIAFAVRRCNRSVHTRNESSSFTMFIWEGDVDLIMKQSGAQYKDVIRGLIYSGLDIFMEDAGS